MTASTMLATTSLISDHAPIGTVETIRRDAERRLSELAPFLEEAEKLRSVLAALGGSAAARRATTVRSAPRATANGANKREIMRTIGEEPGITPREIATRTGIKRTVVASTVNRLKRRGEVLEHPETGPRGGVMLPDATRS